MASTGFPDFLELLQAEERFNDSTSVEKEDAQEWLRVTRMKKLFDAEKDCMDETGQDIFDDWVSVKEKFVAEDDTSGDDDSKTADGDSSELDKLLDRTPLYIPSRGQSRLPKWMAANSKTTATTRTPVTKNSPTRKIPHH
ncbi:uncharacterized protein [Ptychodera flava]|uniref:uncharacterized protein n=1 Tax=Ptychodera flava TaxID=63121 RepID=UPI003969DC40